MTRKNTAFADGQGLECPSCGSEDIYVRDTRAHKDTVRRRRVCKKCEHKFWTMEIECDFNCAEV